MHADLLMLSSTHDIYIYLFHFVGIGCIYRKCISSQLEFGIMFKVERSRKHEDYEAVNFVFFRNHWRTHWNCNATSQQVQTHTQTHSFTQEPNSIKWLEWPSTHNKDRLKIKKYRLWWAVFHTTLIPIKRGKGKQDQERQ